MCIWYCVDKDKAMYWSDKQVVGRWHRLHRGTLLSQKFMRNELLSNNEWITLTTEFEQHFCYAAGAEQMMQEFKTHRIGGMRQAKRLLS
jgi:hypothetical protein